MKKRSEIGETEEVADPKTTLQEALHRRLIAPLDRLVRAIQQEELPGLALRAWHRFGTRFRLSLIAFLIILPAVLGGLFIRTYAVNATALDDLAAVVPMYDRLDSGQLSFGDLFAQWNEHRLFFPRVAMLALGLVTHHNNVAACYFSWFLLCLICGVLFLAHRRMFGNTETALAAFIPVSWLLFNPAQAQNLLQGFQMQVFIAVLFFLLSMYFLATSEGRWWRFALSFVCGVVAAFSMNNGLLAWPIGLLIILWPRQSEPDDLRRRRLWMAFVWCLTGAAVLVSYYVNYQDQGLPLPHGLSKFEYVTRYPWFTVKFFLASMGSLTRSATAAVAAGLLFLLLCAYVLGTMVCRRDARPSSLFYLSLILFALLSLAGWTYHRAFLASIDQALAERAATVTVVGIAGLYLAASSLRTRHADAKGFLMGFLVFLILLSGALSYRYGIREAGPSRREEGRMEAYVLSTYKVQSDDTIANYLMPFPWDPELAKEGARVLEEHGLSVFSTPPLKIDDLTPVAGSTESGIDYINNNLVNNQDSGGVRLSLLEKTVTIWGWAIDQEATDTAGALFVCVDDHWDIPAMCGLDRPDISARFGESRYQASGFMASFATSLVGQGRHELTLKIVTHDKTGYYQSTQGIALEIG